MSSTPAKVRPCFFCKQDCTGGQYQKDRKGRYFHVACLERAKAKKRAEQEETAEINPTLAAALSETPKACPGCQQMVPADAGVCVGCGFNLVTGVPMATSVQRAPKVKKGLAIGSGTEMTPAIIAAGVGVGVVEFGLGIGQAYSGLLAWLSLGWLIGVGLPLGIILLVAAFRSRWYRFFLMFIPFYALLWLNKHCEHPVLKSIGLGYYVAATFVFIVRVMGLLPTP